MLRKESDLRAVSIVPRQEFLFKKSDLVILQLPDDEDEDDLYPMYGLGGMGSANPSVPHPLHIR